ALAAIARVAAMDGAELRFRVTCAARRAAGRLRHALRPPVWDRARITAVLDGTVAPIVGRACDAAVRRQYLDAHRLLSTHLATRPSRWPLRASSRPALADAVRRAFPRAADDARGAADRILAGRWNLLGYRDVGVGNPPEWHADPIHRRRSPPAY